MQRSRRSTRTQPACAQRPLGGRQRSSLPSRTRPGPNARPNRLGHLLADLVAARPDARADRRRRRAGRRSAATPAGDDARRAGRASPRGASATAGLPPFAARARSGRQSAVSDQHRLAGLVRPDARRPPRRARRPRHDRGAVHLAWPAHAARGRRPTACAEPPRGSPRRARGSSPVEQAEVERGVRPLADAALARREDDLVRPGRVPADQLGSLFDQLPRGGQLGLAAVELAVQLAAPQLGEDLPHARRLAPGPSSARSAPLTSRRTSRSRSKYSAQRRELGEREREQRRVGRVRLGERDDLRRRRASLVAQPLDEPRRRRSPRRR